MLFRRRRQARPSLPAKGARSSFLVEVSAYGVVGNGPAVALMAADGDIHLPDAMTLVPNKTKEPHHITPISAVCQAGQGSVWTHVAVEIDVEYDIAKILKERLAEASQ